MRDESEIPLGLSFDDVLLAPRRSDVTSRSDVDTGTRLTRGLRLSVPVISANMDTVTESRMAIAMARAGGLGIIHRFLSIEDQAAEVRRVKRAEAVVIDEPHTIDPTERADAAAATMDELGVSGLVVTDDDGAVLGMLARRDLAFQSGREPVGALMTPRERLVWGAPATTQADAAEIFRRERVEKLPLIDADGRLAGLITARDLTQRADHPDAVTDARGRLAVGAAIGVRGDVIDRARALTEAGADALVLDVAHGHADAALSALDAARAALGDETQLIAGNVATAEGARDLVRAGADAIKIGVGPGSVCTTRVVAGVGVPQLSAVMAAASAAHEHDVPVIADGGIRAGGDLAKAIAAGAESVMVGNLLAGTPESPGVVVTRNGVRVKVFRGMASAPAAAARREAEEIEETDFEPVVPEGVEAVVPLRDEAATVVRNLVGGLRSAMSYSNAHTIPQLHERAEFVRITPGGLRESYPHDVEQR